MKKKTRLVPFVLLLAAAVFFKRGAHDKGLPRESVGTRSALASPLEKTENPAAPERKPASVATGSNSIELRSLNDMTRAMATAAERDPQIKTLVEYLQKSGQEPRVIRDANPDTGEMIIIRTDTPLPGTRYFNAQYFTDESGERFIQHMSFEFKPGPHAMEDALDAVRANFGNLSNKTHERPDYARWELPDNKILWVKKMTAAEGAEDPIHAHEPGEEGAVKVVIEDDIHSGGE